ncbi:MAG: Mo-dependent nitrogenase C-terminal domain-containing protein [Fischerella sp.]|nr:Mo-dependent nitrogenase C-terminal domain-containing protein [Fischerella sp.]
MLNLNQIFVEKSILYFLCQQLDAIKIQNPNVAHFLCKVIPAQCPFEWNIKLFNQVVFHIPPLCKLNPFYEQLVTLRFKCLSYLADECGEDVTPYC